MASIVYEGSGRAHSYVDIFNPMTASTFISTTLEAFQWHGVKMGMQLTFSEEILGSKDPTYFVLAVGT